MNTSTDLTSTQKLAIGHQHVANFLLSHHDMIESLSYETMCDKLGTHWADTPYLSISWSSGESIDLHVHGPEQRDTMRTVRKAIGGLWEKSGVGNQFTISRNWPNTDEENGITVKIGGKRDEVCQKVVTGTKLVDKPEVPYQPARTEEVEEVDWVCGNLLTD